VGADVAYMWEGDPNRGHSARDTNRDHIAG
jgi:hypothetical protein